MKKILAALTVVAMTAGSALAMGPMGGCMGAGCGFGAGPMGGGMGIGMNAADTAVYKKFVADTMSLRQEMMNKHLEIQKEFIKETPDQAVLTKLRGEIIDLRYKIMAERAKAGLPMGGKGMRGGMKGGKHGGMMRGMMNCPMMPAQPAPPAK